jgi:hypothetical protein
MSILKSHKGAQNRNNRGNRKHAYQGHAIARRRIKASYQREIAHRYTHKILKYAQNIHISDCGVCKFFGKKECQLK